MKKQNYQKKGYNSQKGLSSKPFKKLTREMNEEKKKEILAKQTMKLEIIDHIADFLEDKIKNSEQIYIQSAIDYVVQMGYDLEEAKKVSTIIHCMMDLSWANKKFNTPESRNRIQIRIDYIKEILFTMCRPELHDMVQEIVDKHTVLFPQNQII